VFKISNIMRNVLVVFGTIVAFIPMRLNNNSDGADFPKYLDWANAFNQSDIHWLGMTELSPVGIPLFQWSFGPGLIFSLGGLFNDIKPDDAAFVGWLFAVIFWISYIGILLHVTRNNYFLAMFGVGCTFIGTPLGFYSSAYSSESLSYTCLSVVIYWVISRNRFSAADFLMTGIWAAMLVMIRSQLALYLVPVFFLLMYRIRDEGNSWNIPVKHIAAGILPVLISLLAIVTVNYWMTGSPFESVYNFGYDDFKSLDFLHPELLAVLIHPWHGLFVYHPLYLIGFAVLGVMIYKESNQLRQILFAAAALSIVLHIYLHASWYVWWLGENSFGMRGLSISAIILVPAILMHMVEREGQGKSNSVLIAGLFLSNIWSLILLIQGPTQYFTYQQLFTEIRTTIENLIVSHFFDLPVAVLVLGYLGSLKLTLSYPSLSLKNIAMTVVVLLVIHYQISTLYFDNVGMLAISFFSLAILSVLLAGYRVAIGTFQTHSCMLQRIFSAISMIIFITLTVLFINLAVDTNRIVASRISVPITSDHNSAVDVHEVRASLMEYLKVPGFDDKKKRLINYLKYLDTRVADSTL